MPTYQVKCHKCGKLFEEFTRIKDRLGIKCKCGGSTEIQFNGNSVTLQTTMYGREGKPLVLEHMTEGPPFVEVTSKQGLRDAWKEHDCISHTLD